MSIQDPYEWCSSKSTDSKLIANLLALLAIIQLLAVVHSAYGQRQYGFTAREITVTDGDTVTATDDKGIRVIIRLSQIDAPELNQAHGPEAKQYLNGLLNGGSIAVRVEGQDKYGRAIGTLYRDHEDINLRMVEAGEAWVVPQYVREASYVRAQTQAVKSKRGLWARDNPKPPWEWRQDRENGKPAIERKPSPCILLAPYC